MTSVCSVPDGVVIMMYFSLTGWNSASGQMWECEEQAFDALAQEPRIDSIWPNIENARSYIELKILLTDKR